MSSSMLAYKRKMLRENLNDFLEKIEWKEVKKKYLTLDEVKKLAAPDFVTQKTSIL